MNHRWSKKDISTLKSLVEEGKSIDFIANYFNRTAVAIEIKTNRLGLQLCREGRNWKESDLKSFKSDWLDGTLSMRMLEKKYNRTLKSLSTKAYRLNLGPRPSDDEYLSILNICEEMHVSRDRVEYWIKLGLNYKRCKSGRTNYLILTEDLLSFLKEHSYLYNASLISPYLFSPEPDWLRKKRIKDGKDGNKNIRLAYTKKDDDYMVFAFTHGVAIENIALRLGRSVKGIKLRLRALGYYSRWYNDFELEIIKEYSDKVTLLELSDMLPIKRSVRGLKYKCSKLNLPYHISKLTINK